jgi:hypothetical protein
MRLCVIFLVAVHFLSATQTQKPIVNDSQEEQEKYKTSGKVQAEPTPPVAINGATYQKESSATASDNQKGADNKVYSVKVVSQPQDPLYLIYVIINAVIAAVGLGTLIAVFRQGGFMRSQLAAFIEGQRPSLLQIRMEIHRTTFVIRTANTSKWKFTIQESRLLMTVPTKLGSKYFPTRSLISLIKPSTSPLSTRLAFIRGTSR